MIRNPPAEWRSSRRLIGQQATNGLAAGNTFTSGSVLYEAIPVFGAARLRVRAKTLTAGALLDLVFVGPDFDPAQGVAFAFLAGTLYTTGNPAQVTLAAGTEGTITADCYGEGYVLVKLTGSGSGAVTFVDVSQV